ncbi:MAG: SCP2 sterol-binding domain-containing protein [Betaproteobacteria bacterium]|nr:SCP2 sterol-binding domain-containing protein [Betaproteobacteria bacterium]MDH3437709.1 SCP2 sterol-binding domain-containing protein [Betaproteobacteria bacterium]
MRPEPFHLPEALARIAAALPQRPPTFAFCLALNAMRDRLLTDELCAALEGRHLRLQVTDAGLTLDFALKRGRFIPRSEGAGADLTIAATAYDFACLASRSEDSDTLFFARRLVMQGDTDLGLLVKNTLDSANLPALSAADLAPHRVLRRVASLVLPRRA